MTRYKLCIVIKFISEYNVIVIALNVPTSAIALPKISGALVAVPLLHCRTLHIYVRLFFLFYSLFFID